MDRRNQKVEDNDSDECIGVLNWRMRMQYCNRKLKTQKTRRISNSNLKETKFEKTNGLNKTTRERKTYTCTKIKVRSERKF